MGFKEIIEARRNNFKRTEETVIVQDNKDITIGNSTTKNSSTSPFDKIKHNDSDGEYWMAKELQTLLGYQGWDKFKKVIEKGKQTCINVGEDANYHMRHLAHMVSIGSGAQREIQDYRLTRYACYIISMNGDSSKPEIAAAQTYFAVKTRQAELSVSQQVEMPQSITQFDILRQIVLTFEEQQKQITEVKAVLTDQGERLQAVESSLFRKNISSSSVINRNISIGEMADILKDMGYNIGRNGLFSWLRENDFIIRYQKKGYKAKVEWENKGYFINQKKKTETDNGNFETYTLEITPEGQEWLLRVYSLRSKK